MLKFRKLLVIPLLLLGITLFAQTRTLKGKVTAANGQPLAGASVLVKGTTKGVATEADGSFSISVSGKAILVISSIGYSNTEISVDASQTEVPAVSLIEASSITNEVVVTALGITRQAKTLVYATQTVKTSELTGVRDANNVLNSLQGKVANAIVTQGSGGPGSGAKIVLRGNRSLQGSNNALIVVDGVPINNDTYSTAGSDFGSVQGSDGASNINPDDIESLTVLRGASAAALYGSQAGNGVLVITTKKGRKDRTNVDVNSGLVFEKPFALPKVQDSYGQGNGGVLDPSSGESWGAKMTGQSFTNYLGNSASYSAQPNNIKDFFRTGLSLNNSVGVSGGSDRMQTYLSYTNNKIQGIVPENDLMRHTVNLRLSNQISKKFSTDAKITYINQRILNRPRTGEENAPVIDVYQIPRNISISDAKKSETINSLGVPEPTAWPSTLSSIYQNPYWMINRTALNETRDRIMGFISLKYQITDWLSLTGRANLDRTTDQLEEKYSQGTILWATQSGGYYAKTNIITTQQWYDVILSGHNKLSNDFAVSYNVGGIFQDVSYDQNQSVANGLNVTNKFSLNFATTPATSSSSTETQTQSAFGQATFSYKDAVYLDASLRNDWDSRLPAPHTYQYYSVGLSAVISDMVKLPTGISYLKASANYAEVGNGGQFGLLKTTYGYSQGAGNGFLSRSPVLPIPGLKPEIVKNIEASLETRFINNRLGLTLTYYKSNSFNQLLTINLPTATGYSSKYINAGNIQNQGFELVLNGTPIKNKDFSWDVTLNMALNRSKVKRISDDLKIVYLGGGYGRSATPIVEEGGAYGDLLSYRWKRDAKGSLMVTAKGLPVISSAQESIGNFNPKETIGFTNTFEYKRFSLRVLVDGRIGGTMVSGTEMNLAFSGITEGTEKYREGGWNLGGVKADGSSNSTQIKAQDFWQIASGKRYGNGEFFAYNVSNFRIREFSLGYDIPVPSNGFVKTIRFSAVARNLLWIYRGSSTLDIPGLSKRKMWFDPDMSLGNGNFQGVEYGTLPATRSYGFNLKLTF